MNLAEILTRSAEKFGGVDALKEQIARDITAAKAALT